MLMASNAEGLPTHGEPRFLRVTGEVNALCPLPPTLGSRFSSETPCLCAAPEAWGGGRGEETPSALVDIGASVTREPGHRP